MVESLVARDAQGIEAVFEGMHVVDADGHAVGVVDIVRIGEAEAVEAGPSPQPIEAPAQAGEQGPGVDVPGLPPAELMRYGFEPGLPGGVEHILFREGYIRVVHQHLFRHADVSYASARQIARVEGRTVVLSVPEAALARAA